MIRYILTLTLALSFACAHPKPVTHPVMIDTVEVALLSVGHIKGMKDGQEYGCSAFAIAERKFLTVAHCVGDIMRLDGRPVFVTAQDASLDLAILVSDYEMPTLPIRQKPLTRGEAVLGLGYGYSWKYPIITRHFVVILNFSPHPEEIAPGTWFSGGFVGGQSGGALIDQQGQVVGVIQRSDYQAGYGVDAATISKFLATSIKLEE